MWPWLQVGESLLPSFLLVQSLNAIMLIFWARVRAPQRGLPIRPALDLVLLSLVSGAIGGRLLHVLWEAPSFYLQNPAQIFQLTQGGFVYFGGLLAGLASAAFWLRGRPESAGSWFDFAAPLVCLGSAVGRVGCFLAGCCYGGVCVLPWALPFVDENGLSLLRHPTQLYSLAWELGVLIILLSLEKTATSKKPSWLRAPGSLFLLWLLLHSIGRFLIEFVRDDFRGPQFFLSLSQWLALFLAIGACLILRHRNTYPREA